MLAAQALRALAAFDTKAVAKQNIVEAVKNVSSRLGNTPSVCKKCYVHPQIFDAYLDGILMVFMHQDVPGLIGFMGTECGRHGVNIASMNLGRLKLGGDAVAVLNLDQEPPAAVLKIIGSHEKIKSVMIVKLPPAGEMPVWFG